MKATVAVDPGEETGLAAFLAGDLVYYREVTSCHARLAFHRLKDVSSLLMVSRPHLVIEDQFKGRLGFKGAKTLIRRAGRWTACAELLGWRVTNPVMASTWRKAFGIRGRAEVCKAKAQALVYELYGIQVSHNVAEAILLGLYVQDKRDKSMGLLDWARANMEVLVG